MSAWKAGDVALVDGHVALVWDDENSPSALSFVYTDSDGDSCSVWVEGATARPLVVLDPEDNEQTERLARTVLNELRQELALDSGDQAVVLGAIVPALRSLISPPEPTGFGAVVQDAEGERWVLSHTHNVGAPWTRPHLSGAYAWSAINAVAVLSEGVPA